MSKENKQKVKFTISVGDINGIGLETLVKALGSNEIRELSQELLFTLHCPKNVFYEYFEKLQNYSLPNNLLSELNLTIADFTTQKGTQEVIQWGKVSKTSGEIALQSFNNAVNGLFVNGDERCDILLTQPISKESVHLVGWNFPGHTEYLADICEKRLRDDLGSDLNIYGIKNKKEGQVKPLMIISTIAGKVALVTIHTPIKKVSESITYQNIIEKFEQFYFSLKQDYRIKEPKIAILGLNPHAGENGDIGNEEVEVINKVITGLRENSGFGQYKTSIDYTSAFPADGFFAHQLYKNYDGVLAMYHDQGLIPFKMLACGGGVNFTANLPIVRVSADHGTAFPIAGLGIANPQSTIDAILEGLQIFRNREKIA